MKLVVIGATGRTGRELVNEALAQDYQVTAMVRDPARLSATNPNLNVVRADVLDADSLRAGMQGGEAVMSALGVGGRGPVSVFSEGTRNVFDAMQSAGIERFIGISAAGMHADEQDPFILRYVAKPILQMVLRDTYGDLARMEELIEHSQVAWTLVVPTRLTDGKQSSYRIAIDHNVVNAFSVKRANVAHCMLDALNDPTSIAHFVYVAD